MAPSQAALPHFSILQVERGGPLQGAEFEMDVSEAGGRWLVCPWKASLPTTFWPGFLQLPPRSSHSLTAGCSDPEWAAGFSLNENSSRVFPSADCSISLSQPEFP